jgi:hypothetical protein
MFSSFGNNVGEVKKNGAESYYKYGATPLIIQ